MNLRRKISFLFVILWGISTLAQTGVSVEFKSEDDLLLNVDRVVVAQTIDNVNGIYSEVLTDWLISRIENDHQWNVQKLSGLNKTDFFENSEVSKILEDFKAQALVTSRVLRGPQGLSFRMTLYVGSAGMPLAQESRVIPTTDSLEEIKKLFQSVYETLHNRLPHDGEILSRKGTDVTINVGQNWNLKAGQTVDAIQILKIQRHPKHQFMVGAEKSILGKIKITKVDDYLSFGKIVFEKEPNTLRVGTKVLALRATVYPQLPDSLKEAPFGSEPGEWIPTPTPQFGKILLLGGIGNYSQNADLVTFGSASANNNLAPTIRVEGEIWLNQEWYLQLGTMQSAFTLSNPINSDNPGTLNATLSSYSLAAGYNWLLGQDFFGSKLQLSLGMSQWTSDPDRSSPTLAFSRTQFGGLYLGFGGFISLDAQSPWDVGAQFKYYLTGNVSESPSSGSASNVNMIDFSVLGRYRKTNRMSYIGTVIFENYSADFAGSGSRPDPAQEISHRINTFMLGIEYSF